MGAFYEGWSFLRVTIKQTIAIIGLRNYNFAIVTISDLGGTIFAMQPPVPIIALITDVSCFCTTANKCGTFSRITMKPPVQSVGFNNNHTRLQVSYLSLPVYILTVVIHHALKSVSVQYRFVIINGLLYQTYPNKIEILAHIYLHPSRVKLWQCADQRGSVYDPPLLLPKLGGGAQLAIRKSCALNAGSHFRRLSRALADARRTPFMMDNQDERDRARGRINEIIDTLVKRAKGQHPKWEPDLEQVYCSVFKRALPEHHRLKPTDLVTWALLFGIGGVNMRKYLGPHAHRNIQKKHIRCILATLKELNIFYDDNEIGDAPSTWFPLLDRAFEAVKEDTGGGIAAQPAHNTGLPSRHYHRADIEPVDQTVLTPSLVRSSAVETEIPDVAAMTVSDHLNGVQFRVPQKPKTFVGRSTSAINNALSFHGTIALHGLRGVGKTSLAAAYAEDYSSHYDDIIWIQAQTDASIRASLLALGARFKVQDDNKDEAIKKVLEALRGKNERALLIYDNAKDVHSVELYLPSRGAAHVIITSNSHNWDKVAKPMEVEVWEPNVGADYLVQRLHRHQDREAAEALSEALGGLPLALEQAAAYCGHCEASFSEYIDTFRANPVETLDDQDYAVKEYHPNVRIEKKYRLTVRRTFELVIGLLKEKEEEMDSEDTRRSKQQKGLAAELTLVYAALLAPFAIPHLMTPLVFIFGHKYWQRRAVGERAGRIFR